MVRPAAILFTVAFMALACVPQAKPRAAATNGGAIDHDKLRLTQGKAADLGDGTSAVVGNVSYAHVSEGRNLSLCTIVVTRGGQTQEVSLGREDGGDQAPSSGDAFGWRFTLEMVDAYHQPSTAWVKVQRIHPPVD